MRLSQPGYWLLSGQMVAYRLNPGITEPCRNRNRNLEMMGEFASMISSSWKRFGTGKKTRQWSRLCTIVARRGFDDPGTRMSVPSPTRTHKYMEEAQTQSLLEFL